jgi:prophage regulatory protein
MNLDALENEWAAHQEVDSEMPQEGREANEKIASALAAPTARIPSGVIMLPTPVVCERRKKGRSSHYVDIQSGLFIEPVAIGVRSRATLDYEVDILIAADIAGKSDEEKRELVRKLRAARKGVL